MEMFRILEDFHILRGIRQNSRLIECASKAMVLAPGKYLCSLSVDQKPKIKTCFLHKSPIITDDPADDIWRSTHKLTPRGKWINESPTLDAY